MTPNARAQKWKPVTYNVRFFTFIPSKLLAAFENFSILFSVSYLFIQEIHKYIALSTLMGISSKPKIPDY